MKQSTSIVELLQKTVEMKGSELYLVTGAPPSFRVNGDLVPGEYGPLDAPGCESLMTSILTEDQKTILEETKSVTFAFGMRGLSRFHAHIFYQRSALTGTFKTVPMRTPSIDDIGLPEAAQRLVDRSRGLILISGPQDSGATTTLAAYVDSINAHHRKVIVSVESPIHYLHAPVSMPAEVH